MNERRFRLSLAAIAVVGLGVRVVAMFTVATHNPDGGDPLYYHVQANLLADGHGFAEPFTWLDGGGLTPSAMHPPAFPVLLSAASLLGGTGFAAHKLAASIAGVATIVVLGLLARRLAGPRAGLIVAAIAAVHPNLWVVDGILMPEGLFGLTIALVLLAAYATIDDPTPRRIALLGAAIGAAALTRGEALLLGPLVALPLIVRDRRLPLARVERLALAGVACVAVVSPWLVRNAVTFDGPPMLSVNADEVVRNANCDLTWHGDLLGFWAFACYLGQPPAGLDEAERGRSWRDEGLAYIGDDPGRLPVVAAARLGRVWELYRPFQNTHLATIEGRHLGVTRAGLAAYWLSIPLAVVGTLALRRGQRQLWPLLSMFVVVSITAVLAYGATRFRMPAEIALVLLAGIGLAQSRWLASAR